MPFIGVLISWLIWARKDSFALAISSVSCLVIRKLLLHLDPVRDILRKADDIGLRAWLFHPEILIQEIDDLLPSLLITQNSPLTAFLASRMASYILFEAGMMFDGDDLPDIAAQHLFLLITQNPADGRVDGKEFPGHVVGADEGLTIIEKVAVSFFAELYFLLEFLFSVIRTT
jgi:hypothetical protein